MLLRCAASGEAEPPSSSGPGRRPFKAVTGIRTPLGARRAARDAVRRLIGSCGAVWSARRPVKAEAAGSNPVRTAEPSLRRRPRGRVAQLAERAPEKREVTGSTPVPATTKALVTALRWARASSCGRRRATHVPHRATFFRRIAPCRLVPGRVGSFADVLAHDLATTRRTWDTRQVVFVESPKRLFVIHGLPTRNPGPPRARIGGNLARPVARPSNAAREQATPARDPRSGRCATSALCQPSRGFRDGRSLYRRLRVPGAGQIARKIGPLPTVIGADTAPVAVVITDTVPAPLLTTSLVTKLSTEELTT